MGVELRNADGLRDLKNYLDLRQDSEKLGKLLDKWSRETETDGWTLWPSNLQPGTDCHPGEVPKGLAGGKTGITEASLPG